MRVRLERTLELPSVRLRIQDWPGVAGPLVHVPDPRSPHKGALVSALADALTPRYRVMSILPRADSAYQVDAADLLASLDQFGFPGPVVLAESLGCVAALLVAAWHPRRLAGLVLIDSDFGPCTGDLPMTRALRDCPPDLGALRQAVECPQLELSHASSVAPDVERFLVQLGLT